MFYSKKFKRFQNIKHCFFSRKGGFSKGLYQSLKPYYDIEADDQRMREVKADIRQNFDFLRKTYPQRLEFLDTL